MKNLTSRTLHSIHESFFHMYVKTHTHFGPQTCENTHLSVGKLFYIILVSEYTHIYILDI